jgi:hypothetical protein
MVNAGITHPIISAWSAKAYIFSLASRTVINFPIFAECSAVEKAQ